MDDAFIRPVAGFASCPAAFELAFDDFEHLPARQIDAPLIGPAQKAELTWDIENHAHAPQKGPAIKREQNSRPV
jgi:hypothetical protein